MGDAATTDRLDTTHDPIHLSPIPPVRPRDACSRRSAQHLANSPLAALESAAAKTPIMSRRAPNPAAERAAQNQATIKSLLKLEPNKVCADCKRNKRALSLPRHRRI